MEILTAAADMAGGWRLVGWRLAVGGRLAVGWWRSCLGQGKGCASFFSVSAIVHRAGQAGRRSHKTATDGVKKPEVVFAPTSRRRNVTGSPTLQVAPTLFFSVVRTVRSVLRELLQVG